MKNILTYLTALLVVTACATTTDHLAQGMIYVQQKDFANAVSEFQSEIAVRPSPEAYANLGAAYMQQGKNNLALDALRKGEGMDPSHVAVTYNLTALHSVADRTDVALQYLDRTLANGFKNYDAIRFDPDLANLRGEPEFRTTLEKHKVFLQ